ncbi:iron-siderophore ABC transporter substrate-binding protein [Anabaena sp. FACHB-709]|nr:MULTISPECIES: iron-siderophore ABC transporter substrate-binding protein [Nostocaceae]MBD2261890.1 iron-siderophore ABC transporter substrate-binding protein [Anabaena sp. FACHB-709]MBD2271475.1 iron-siderophore ABC transporter substrate-binding protein [Nostoc sp. PCC 7120 = FACHB-418]MBD2282255.1 iron-siderophore ABC transporter substrate-binding protein [Anabaena cylindrica FACHB-170]MBD2348367.1 iron-siderophore ABC transporter substrate-binding protein [Trichormus variabilis FACHB-171]
MAVVLFSACTNNVSQKLTNSAELLPSQCRIVKHLTGETCVPNIPQRIIAASEPALEAALILDFKPIGTTNYAQQADYLRERFESSDSVGLDSRQLSLEKILTIKPDLILATDDYGEQQELYDRLSQMAPTVIAKWWDGQSIRWKECFQLFAQAFGKTSEAEETVNAYNQRIAELQQQMGDRLPNTVISIIEIYPDRIRLYGKTKTVSLSSTIIEDIGLPRPPSQEEGMDISLESIGDADGDIIFLTARDPEAQLYQQVLNHPLWKQLKAVQAGKVYKVENSYWGGSGYIAANLVLDDLFKYLVK